TILPLIQIILLILERTVIGGNKTVLHGDSVILPCKLIDTTETLTQISWQRKTRGKPQLDSFFTVVPPDKQRYLNGNDNRFRFAGNASEMDGSLQLSNVTLLDEGTYSCIFTLFPTGDYKTDIPLTVIGIICAGLEETMANIKEENTLNSLTKNRRKR
uniref:Ig-like domain-containing protein n=1 Tax=Echeneis naucrates TaxID=173247 RepID=A0A665U2A8_ECHNA